MQGGRGKRERIEKEEVETGRARSIQREQNKTHERKFTKEPVSKFSKKNPESY